MTERRQRIQRIFPSDVPTIRARVEAGETLASIGSTYGVTKSTVGAAIHRASVVRADRCAMISDDDVVSVRERCANGEDYRSIANSMGVREDTISNIALGKTYRSVGGPISTTRNERHGRSRSPEHTTWTGMINRCNNVNQPRYGGRGISVCERWRNSFSLFLADMGPKPSPAHSIDRIDNDGNYEPSNCRWATGVEQLRNTRRNHIIEIDGVAKSLAEWAETSGVEATTIRRRLRLGWTPEAAVTAYADRVRQVNRKTRTGR